MEKVYEFVKGCETYYLATMDGESPRVRPFGTVNIYNGKLYIQTGKSKEVYKQIMANPQVELCCFNGERWVRISGRLVNDDSREAKADMLDHYPQLKAMYSADDENTAVLYFEDSKAVFYSFTEAPETHNF